MCLKYGNDVMGKSRVEDDNEMCLNLYKVLNVTTLSA